MSDGDVPGGSRPEGGSPDWLPHSLPRPKLPLSTKVGWSDFVSYRPPAKPSLSDMEQMGSGREAEFRFNELRSEHFGSFGPVFTSTMASLHTTLTERAVANLSGPPGARPGAVIDGLPNVGKSTILTEFGRYYELLLRRKYGEGMLEDGVSEWIPVVYHSLNARTTIKALNAGLANFYGAPIPRYHATSHQLTKLVVECAQRCATTLFLIDDIHYLKLSNESDRQVNNHLKQLMNETSATFVYAGVGCENTELFSEGQPNDKLALGQTRGRFARFSVDHFQVDTTQGESEWIKLLGAFEGQLVLKKAKKGMLTGMSKYLHQRTGGFVGSLSNLVRLAAIKAIETGEENITRDLLERVQIDEAAENEWRKNRRKKGRKRPPGR